jgi:hypothetical protein
VDDAVAVGVVQGLADLVRDGERLIEREPVAGGGLEQVLHGPAAHELGYEVGLSPLLADVEDGDDVGVVAEPAHRLRLAADAGLALFIQPLGANEREGDLAVQPRVVHQVDPLLASLSEEAPGFVSAIDEGLRTER